MRDLAASTGAETIAEMIETEADAALMRKLGISLGQGWLFGKPGPLPVAKAKAQSKPAREWR
jgi:EAL domain-containing protein (putative c-di-GMP-specific phosphodiesterase class I)